MNQFRTQNLYHGRYNLSSDTMNNKKVTKVSPRPSVPVSYIQVVLAESKPKALRQKRPRAPRPQAPDPLADVFPDGRFPVGETQEYQNQRRRYRMIGGLQRPSPYGKGTMDDFYNCLRHAAEVQWLTRKYIRDKVRVGVSVRDICNDLEAKALSLTGRKGINAGLAYPASCALNNMLQFTPNTSTDIVIGANDLVKIDFGIQIKGYIASAALTLCFTTKYDELLDAVRECTEEGIRAAGIDAYLTEVGEAMREVMNSRELDLDGKTYPLALVGNLYGGRKLGYYNLDAGKSIPLGAICSPPVRMLENEYYVIGCYGTTGSGLAFDGSDCSVFRRLPGIATKLRQSKSLWSLINKEFGMLPFCKRWLDSLEEQDYEKGIRELYQLNHLEASVPLYDTAGCYTAQFHQTVLLRPSCKEIVTRSYDF